MKHIAPIVQAELDRLMHSSGVTSTQMKAAIRGCAYCRWADRWPSAPRLPHSYRGVVSETH